MSATDSAMQDSGQRIRTQHQQEVALLRSKLVALRQRENIWHAERDRLLEALQSTVRCFCIRGFVVGHFDPHQRDLTFTSPHHHPLCVGNPFVAHVLQQQGSRCVSRPPEVCMQALGHAHGSQFGSVRDSINAAQAELAALTPPPLQHAHLDSALPSLRIPQHTAATRADRHGTRATSLAARSVHSAESAQSTAAVAAPQRSLCNSAAPAATAASPVLQRLLRGSLRPSAPDLASDEPPTQAVICRRALHTPADHSRQQAARQAVHAMVPAAECVQSHDASLLQSMQMRSARAPVRASPAARVPLPAIRESTCESRASLRSHHTSISELAPLRVSSGTLLPTQTTAGHHRSRQDVLRQSINVAQSSSSSASSESICDRAAALLERCQRRLALQRQRNGATYAEHRHHAGAASRRTPQQQPAQRAHEHAGAGRQHNMASDVTALRSATRALLHDAYATAESDTARTRFASAASSGGSSDQQEHNAAAVWETPVMQPTGPAPKQGHDSATFDPSAVPSVAGPRTPDIATPPAARLPEALGRYPDTPPRAPVRVSERQTPEYSSPLLAGRTSAAGSAAAEQCTPQLHQGRALLAQSSGSEHVALAHHSPLAHSNSQQQRRHKAAASDSPSVQWGLHMSNPRPSTTSPVQHCSQQRQSHEQQAQVGTAAAALAAAADELYGCLSRTISLSDVDAEADEPAIDAFLAWQGAS